jgi:chemotaxis regulatin CheY-phosphate phosphatase CheZ
VVNGASSAHAVAERIVETEGDVPARLPAPAGDGDDEYYREVSNDVFRDIGQMAKQLSASMMELPAEDRRAGRSNLDEAGEKIEDAKAKLRDIVDMTEKATMDILDQVEKVQAQTGEVKDVLSFLRDHKAFQVVAAEDGGGAEAPAVSGDIARAREMLAALDTGGGGKDAAAGFAFDLDTVFQTMYELCTNEAVKGHLTTARERAAEIFDQDGFAADLNRRIAGLAPDGDNFLSVPIPDLLAALAANCSDQATVNLMKNMDKNRAAIFLDGTVPLEAVPAAASPGDAAGGEGGGKEEILALLDQAVEKARTLEARAGAVNGSVMSPEDKEEIFAKIEEAFARASGINVDTSKITEVLSFQDLSGQQIMKIIKLLSDFQVQLLALMVSFGSRLKYKEENAELTVEESRRLAQEEVDRYLGEAAAGDASAAEKGAPLDQETVNRMLEEFGF